MRTFIEEQNQILDASMVAELARGIVADKVPPVTQQQTLSRLGDERLQAVVSGFSTALERGDVDGLIALLTEDVTWSMPPLPRQTLRKMTDSRVGPGAAAVSGSRNSACRCCRGASQRRRRPRSRRPRYR